MRVLLATNNPGKVREFTRLLGNGDGIDRIEDERHVVQVDWLLRRPSQQGNAAWLRRGGGCHQFPPMHTGDAGAGAWIPRTICTGMIRQISVSTTA